MSRTSTKIEKELRDKGYSWRMESDGSFSMGWEDHRGNPRSIFFPEDRSIKPIADKFGDYSLEELDDAEKAYGIELAKRGEATAEEVAKKEATAAEYDNIVARDLQDVFDAELREEGEVEDLDSVVPNLVPATRVPTSEPRSRGASPARGSRGRRGRS